MATLKVRDRTTNKFKDAQIDDADYERLKDYKYLIDKNSKDPFRETVTPDGKRPRIALKRDVLGFDLGDPRRVCYVDKNNVYDCRRSNLKTKEDKEGEAMVKIVKPIKVETPELDTTVTAKTKTKVKTVAAPVVTAPVVTATAAKSVEVCSKIVLPDSMDVKKSLLSQLGEDKLLELLSMEDLLGAWAETHGYEKKQA
jgi:hypothetical protein